MKVSTRSTPLDILSIREGVKEIRIFTHLQKVTLVLEGGEAPLLEYYTFQEFYNLLQKAAAEQP